jgi:hypothetical protein
MMIIKNIDLQLIKTEKREGTSKQGTPYLFYTCKFLDNEGDMILLKLSKPLLEDKKLIENLMSSINVPATIDLGLYPSAFTFKGIVLKIDL